MDKKKKIIWINPLSHYVYGGWMKLFNSYFNLIIFDNKKTNITCGQHFNLENYLLKSLHPFGTFFNLYSNPLGNIGGTKIVGDIFTNSLCYRFFFHKNIIFYCEYFDYQGNSRIKKVIGRVILYIFRNKKVLVPTYKSFRTISQYVKNTYYFPQIYTGKLGNTPKLLRENESLKILFIGDSQDWKKNVELLLKMMTELQGFNITLHLVGRRNDRLFTQYKDLFDSRVVISHGYVSHDEIEEIYSNNDIFILASHIDPIGAVILEAMGQGLAIICSAHVGSSGYVKEKSNGYIIPNNNVEEYKSKILYLYNNRQELLRLRKKSIDIVKESYWIGNDKLMQQKYQDFLNVIS